MPNHEDTTSGTIPIPEQPVLPESLVAPEVPTLSEQDHDVAQDIPAVSARYQAPQSPSPDLDVNATSPSNRSETFSFGTIFSRELWFLAPVSSLTWRSAAVMTATFWYTMVTFIVLMTLLSLSIGFIVMWVGLPLLFATLFASTWLSNPIRTLVNTAFDLDIAAPVYRKAEPSAGLHRKLTTVIMDPARWRSIAFHCAAFLLSTIGMIVFICLFGASIGGILAFAYRSQGDFPLSRLFLLMGAGILGLYLSSWIIQAHAQALCGLTKALLGPGRDEQLAKRVEDLTESRSGVVAAADDERRRIERDLHDGAQQRLVALSVDLGISRREAEANPELAIEALERAQGEVQSSLSELRDLVRGVHPQILTDRGLDAALSALAARSPIPVSVEVADPKAIAALPTSISAAAYFVVSECLTNTARHSGAMAAAVHVQYRDERLYVVVSDNGVGGAQALPGGGLHGLRRRVEALDGTWTFSSPAGGGTTVEVSLPCAS